MNELARVVHELSTGEEGAGASTHLTRLEQAALADLQPLLRLSPRDLAALLAQGQWPEEWWVPPSAGERARS
jgi:hypothetical protein